jgi:hypothetical protein
MEVTLNANPGPGDDNYFRASAANFRQIGTTNQLEICLYGNNEDGYVNLYFPVSIETVDAMLSLFKKIQEYGIAE